MKKTSNMEHYNELFPSTLRAFMDAHPETGKQTTQAALAKHLTCRPQTVSLYCTGETQPSPDKLLKIAEYFNVTVDYLLTGKKPENKSARDLLGLSERTVQALALVNDGYWEDTPAMLPILDCLLGDKDFYLAIEKAAMYEERKIEGLADDYLQFLEWKAAGYLHTYLLAFFSRNLIKTSAILRGDG